MPDYTLPRAERLRSLKAIRRMFDEGHSGFVYPFRYVSLVEAESAQLQVSSSRRVEVMFSVPKKFHKRANRRNLLKRRTREAYRLHRDLLRERLQQQGTTLRLALIYSTKECYTYKTISHAVQRILEQISQHV